jgi:hypothetical protein
VIVTIGVPATVAAKKATDRIPIVFVVGDAVGRGLVVTLTQPVGNATGTSGQIIERQAKRVELLQKLSPGMARVAVLVNANLGFPPTMFRDLRPRGVEIFIEFGARMTWIEHSQPLLGSEPMRSSCRTVGFAPAPKSWKPSPACGFQLSFPSANTSNWRPAFLWTDWDPQLSWTALSRQDPRSQTGGLAHRAADGI